MVVMPTDLSSKRVVVTGGAGFLGRVVCRKLRERGCGEVLVPHWPDYDFTREDQVARLYREMRPEVILHLAAEVGGIGARLQDALLSRWPLLPLLARLQARVERFDWRPTESFESLSDQNSVKLNYSYQHSCTLARIR